MLSRYIHEAMKRARYKTLPDGTYFGQIPGIAGVWANEAAAMAAIAANQTRVARYFIVPSMSYL